MMDYIGKSSNFDLRRSQIVPVAVEWTFKFGKPVYVDSRLEAELSVLRVGSTSVQYNVAFFDQSTARAVALGAAVDVFVIAQRCVRRRFRPM